MTAQLSLQTGLSVSCCQSVIGGIPWGMASVPFGAQDEIARHVLRRLIALESRGQPVKYHWLLRTDPFGSCFINLSYLR